MATMIDELQSELRQFTGTENYYRHWMNSRFVYTDGVRYLAEKAGAHWLLDLIFSHQAEIIRRSLDDPRYRMEFQVWRVQHDGNGGCRVYCDDGDGLEMASQDVPFTDFPELENFRLYLVHDRAKVCLYLPSEH
ncbi:MAG: hypothetical protein SFX18_02665 [Pirellulales bacterium]|nr:hypothetical protein [Pirellulales bacterium]